MIKNQLSFNDGYAQIYKTGNIAIPGNQPKEGLTLKAKLRYENRIVGFSRFYKALMAEVKIDKTIIVPAGVKVSPQDVIILNGDTDEQYSIKQVQEKTDSVPRSLLISLSRIEAKYDT